MPSERARRLSEMLEPPHTWWSLPAWLVWRFRQQPDQIAEQLMEVEAACGCQWCNICGIPIMDGPFIDGYCQQRREHDGPCRTGRVV